MQEQPITFFEITTVAAYLAFSRVPADLTVIEVGMGGRYDATNVIDPVLSAITPIGYDHTGFLGDKLEGIAGGEGRNPEACRAGGDRPPARGERRRSSPTRRPSSPCRSSAWAANGR